MTTKIELTSGTQTRKSGLRNLLWLSPLAMLIGTVANLSLYALAGLLFPEVTAWTGAGVGQIVGATIVYLLIGTIVFALVAKVSSRPARNYLIVATLGLLLSLALPIGAVFGFGTPPASVITAVILSLMHIITYAISVPMFIRLVLK